MRNIVIDQQDCRISVERECLIVSHATYLKAKTIPLRQLDSLVIQARMQLDSQMLCMLTGYGIRVQFVPSRGHGQHCFVTGEVHKDARRRLKHFAIAQNEVERRHWAACIVQLRLRGQRLLLIKFAQRFPERLDRLMIAAAKIHVMQQRIDHTLSIDTIRGLEGRASAVFFADYQLLFAPQLEFHNRNRRPPLDPVNVILSLAFSLLQGIFRQAAYEAGLDVSIGALHELSYGRDSFVCDLIELRRSAIELWVWQLFADEVLTPLHFDYSDAPGHLPCLLDKAGRAKFYMSFSSIQDQLLQDARQIVWIFARRLSPEKHLPH